MPTSEKRIAANRANAAKSTGPTTPVGKQNSARNGTRHGILANAVLIDNESRERFATLLNSFNADFHPANNTERLLVEKMAVSHWRLLRLWAAESAGIVHEIRRQSDSANSEEPSTRTMLAIRTIGDTERHPDLMGRYEHRYDRQYYRALEALARLQEARIASGSTQARIASGSTQARTSEPKTTPKTTPVPHEPIQLQETKAPAETDEPMKQPGEATLQTLEPTHHPGEAIQKPAEPDPKLTQPDPTPAIPVK